jgi:hypothetical protein
MESSGLTSVCCAFSIRCLTKTTKANPLLPVEKIGLQCLSFLPPTLTIDCDVNNDGKF